MRAADVLPHSWSASSDSVAAFVTGALDAERLVLIKPVDGDVDVVDACFGQVLPRGLPWATIGWTRAAVLSEMLDSGSMGEAGFRAT
jgi:hypothetical protein